MLNFVLMALILLAMMVPVAIIGALVLTLKGVHSIDLSVFDFYIVITSAHALALLVALEVAVILGAAYLVVHTQGLRISA